MIITRGQDNTKARNTNKIVILKGQKYIIYVQNKGAVAGRLLLFPGVEMKYPNIEHERIRRGMRRGQVAESINISRDTYMFFVEGVFPIPSNIVSGLAALFGCSPDYLLAPDRRGERWRRYRNIGRR